MRQIFQNLGTGETILAEVPIPQLGHGCLRVASTISLVSLGTEKMLIEFGKSSLLAKAKLQPEKVKQVLQKVKTDGLWATIDAVKAKLDTPIPLGYCNVGCVVESNASDRFRTGDRVASNGPHAEQVVVPSLLAAKIPDNVSDEAAAFTVVGAIALQGVRLVQPTLGERIVVSGLGLLGLLAVQILRANGCQVLGIDLDPRKLRLAEQFGATTVDLSCGQDPVRVAEHWTKGQGVDAVLITASTSSHELVHQAASMCRKRGRIVLVGVTGLNLQRSDFYEKELTFQVSCSYGPGRYDDAYERYGLDYPIGFVRWTEQRNFETVLHLMSERKLDVLPLITHRFRYADALDAYSALDNADVLGIQLHYEPSDVNDTKLGSADQLRGRFERDTSARNGRQEPSQRTSLGLGVIGAGAFATRMLLPLLPSSGVKRISIASNTGVSAAHAAKKFGFERCTSDYFEILSDPGIDAVIITTPHNLHAKLVCEALSAGKHVFVEKPLALNLVEIEQVSDALATSSHQCLMVGFNRRFSPHAAKMKQWLEAAPGSKAVVITVNAGAIPKSHWTQTKDVGGGRIVGEACHFVDLARYLVSESIVSHDASVMTSGDGCLGDCATLTLSFADGSIASIHYLANGSKDYPKERIEVFAAGRVIVCENFRATREFGSRRRFRTRRQDKGHSECLKHFINAAQRNDLCPIPREQLLEVSSTAILLAQSVREQLAGH